MIPILLVYEQTSLKSWFGLSQVSEHHVYNSNDIKDKMVITEILHSIYLFMTSTLQVSDLPKA